MKSTYVKLVGVVSAAALLTGCVTDENGNTVMGAVLGAAAGATICAISGANDTECALLIAGGAALGGTIGNEMDRRDRERRDAAMQQALAAQGPTQVQWTNPETNNSGGIEALSSYRDQQGNTCRDINETYEREGQTITDSYTICTTPGGESFTK